MRHCRHGVIQDQAMVRAAGFEHGEDNLKHADFETDAVLGEVVVIEDDVEAGEFFCCGIAGAVQSGERFVTNIDNRPLLSCLRSRQHFKEGRSLAEMETRLELAWHGTSPSLATKNDRRTLI